MVLLFLISKRFEKINLNLFGWEVLNHNLDGPLSLGSGVR
jgi:hypothetical protein